MAFWEKLLLFNSELLKDRFFSWTGNLVLGLTLCQFLLLVFFWRSLPPELPLFYSRPWGQEQLTGKNLFVILPISLVFLSLLNFFWINFFLTREKLLAQIFMAATGLFSLLLTITFFKILFLFLF